MEIPNIKEPENVFLENPELMESLCYHNIYRPYIDDNRKEKSYLILALLSIGNDY